MITAALVFAYLSTGSMPVATPDRHPVASECAIADAECIQQHDSNVLTLAIMSENPEVCAASTHSDACAESVKMVLGTLTIEDHDPILTDSCSYVMAAFNGHAILYSPETGRTRQAWIRGRNYVTGHFVGDCGKKKAR